MKPRGLCRWIGHKYDPEAHVYTNVNYCVRCGDDDMCNGLLEPAWVERFLMGYWNARAAVAGIWREFREWLKCPCCGERFGRHDDDTCIPF